MKIEKPTGYKLTEKLKRVRRRHPLTATEQALYHELVSICNEDEWPEVFTCSNDQLFRALNISETTLIAARLTLIQQGLIYYRSGKSKRAFSSYSFTKKLSTTPAIGTNAGTNPLVNAGTNAGTNPDTNAGDYNKTETKTETKHSVTDVTVGDSEKQEGSKKPEAGQKEKSSAKKEKGDDDPPQEESSLYTKCIDIYNDFVIERTGMGAKIKPRSGKAMKDIITYLSREARAKNKDRPQEEVEARVVQVWEGTLARETWDMLRPYLRNKIKLEDIEFEFVNILSEIKNGTNSQAGNTGTGGNGRPGQSAGTARGRGGSISDIQNAKRPGTTDNPEREEFTPIEVVK